MPEFSMPHDSKADEDNKDDRVYYAADFARYFAQFIANGVYPNPANGLKVDASGGSMVLNINSGSAFINGCTYVLYDEKLQMAVTPASLTYNRRDSIVVQLDNTQRWMKVLYKEGKAASNPIAPALVRNEDIYELKLAEILVRSGVQSITQSDLTDTRFNKEVCGVVTNVVQTVDTTKLFNQYQTYLNQQIALWDSRKTQQSTDWLGQMNSQKAGFDAQMAEIEGVYAALQTNIGMLQTVDFENLLQFPGCIQQTVKSGSGFKETITIEATGKKVAERITTKNGTGYVEEVKAYERDGNTIMKQFTVTTTKTTGGFQTKVSGVYTPPEGGSPVMETRLKALEETAVTKGNINLIENTF